MVPVIRTRSTGGNWEHTREGLGLCLVHFRLQEWPLRVKQIKDVTALLDIVPDHSRIKATIVDEVIQINGSLGPPIGKYHRIEHEGD
jgi:hypothetical protein